MDSPILRKEEGRGGGSTGTSPVVSIVLLPTMDEGLGGSAIGSACLPLARFCEPVKLHLESANA